MLGNTQNNLNFFEGKKIMRKELKNSQGKEEIF